MPHNLAFMHHIARLADPADVTTELRVTKVKDAEPDDRDQRPFYQIELFITEGRPGG